MLRMQKRISSCDCGRPTKEKSSFVTKSKKYETRSGAQRPQEDNNISSVNDDVEVNSLKLKDVKDLDLENMDQTETIISQQPINESLNYKKSPVNLSKATINKPCDNNVVPNGNARSISGDVLDINIITNTKELNLDEIECKSVRSNMIFEDSQICDENKTLLTENNKDESVKLLVEDKQNGVCESCECNDDCKVKCSCIIKVPKTYNSNGNLDESFNENDNGVTANGFLNGGKHSPRNKEKLNKECVNGENGKSPKGDENIDLIISGDRKKRKSNFEKIFDSYAEFGCHSDKRRSRRPPISYSPEPSRRIKLESLFDDRSPMAPKAIGKRGQKGVKKPRQKGPIFHYLDLYIRNKDIKLQSLKHEETEEPLIDPSNIKKEEDDLILDEPCQDVLSPILISPTSVQSSSSLKSPSAFPESLNLSSENLNGNDILDIPKPSEPCEKEIKPLSPMSKLMNSTSEFNVPSNLDNPFSPDMSSHGSEENFSPKPSTRVSPPPMPMPMSPEEFNLENGIDTMPKKKGKGNKSKKAKKEKPKELSYDAEVSRVLGYRHNKGKNEFLVLFHNGTSNWIIQDNNITVVDPFKDFFEHAENELSTINRLAYFIIKNPDISNEFHSDTESNPDTPSDKAKKNLHSNPVQNSNGLTKKTKDNSSHTNNGTVAPPKKNPNGTCYVNCVSHSLDSDSDVDEKVDNTCADNVDYIQNAFNEGLNENVNKTDLNELCNYVMSSRHIKLYPFETNKDIVFKRDEEFMHIYLKNVRKIHDDSRHKIEEHLDIRSCEKLIYTLEDCAVDDSCEVVVISGIEEYFALKNVFDKLLKKPATVEGRNYEQDVSMLRYLIQTIRNFTKPICAVIKKTASGLPASMLSLFDMVFDERGENFVKKPVNPKPVSKKTNKKKKIDTKKSDQSSNDEQMNKDDNFQSYLFPRLMGLTESNESQIMGEGQRNTDFNDCVSSDYYNKRMLSMQLRKSLRHMKSNSKIQIKSRGRNASVNSEEDTEESVSEPYYVTTTSSAPSIPSDILQKNLNSLEKEIEREKELTKKSMDELKSILLSMESY